MRMACSEKLEKLTFYGFPIGESLACEDLLCGSVCYQGTRQRMREECTSHLWSVVSIPSRLLKGMWCVEFGEILLGWIRCLVKLHRGHKEKSKWEFPLCFSMIKGRNFNKAGWILLVRRRPHMGRCSVCCWLRNHHAIDVGQHVWVCSVVSK